MNYTYKIGGVVVLLVLSFLFLLQKDQSAGAESSSAVSNPCRPSIESRINGTFRGWSGRTIFKLSNGQIWQQLSGESFSDHKESPAVTIFSSGCICEMHVEGERKGVSVMKVGSGMFGCSCDPEIKSRIEGTFEGWGYDTIFKLTNGQRWKQTGMGLGLSLRLSPRVAIFPSSYLCEMLVDGVDETVTVIRIG